MLAICLFIILTRSFYFANSYYIQYDEAWNYNYFLAHNPVYTIFAYNNYPLHNLVSSFFLTFLPANTVVLRLPSILIGIFSCLFVFAIIQKYGTILYYPYVQCVCLHAYQLQYYI
ncbi:MAG: hypothetical protein UZ11_BCD004000430 [Bacteroidetes bacterium OLB11]|nr:MAG: hypothetical protein UZ11_BCD004000430 [Bacteroidetes bacterium OLB11]